MRCDSFAVRFQKDFNAKEKLNLAGLIKVVHPKGHQFVGCYLINGLRSELPSAHHPSPGHLSTDIFTRDAPQYSSIASERNKWQIYQHKV